MSILADDGSKVMRIDEVHQKGKAASIAAESWIQQQTSLQTMVQAHNENIGSLTATVRNLEQQVKAIARVMATQNVQKISETLKMAQDDLQRSMMQYVNDKNKEIMVMVEKEVAEVVDAKAGLGKKIDNVESSLIAMMGARTEEAASQRHAMKQELEKVVDMVKNMPDIVEKCTKQSNLLESKLNDLRKNLKQFEIEHERANVEQDRQVAMMMTEIRNAHEASKDKLSEESRALAKSISKHEVNLDDKLKSIHELIDREQKDRGEVIKQLTNSVEDKVHALRLDVERSLQTVESQMDRKVRPFNVSVTDVKHMIEEERTHREAAIQDVSRAIQKERKDRDHDEEKLLSMISACTVTLGKMHKVS
eukprot:TRINITY_DN46207_c0_g1_i1.p1 TRINITY_DN46207_c0_g1~~TRINITY_DN46207_c0_g1_i1.p1  ORF type:complete len:427 (+),score=130.69 TRINITY_DN46207_c0_g1_i1:192-1283(+)